MPLTLGKTQFSQNTNDSFVGNAIWIEDTDNIIPDNNILSVPRIGVEYAGEDAKLPYRFYIKNNKWISK